VIDGGIHVGITPSSSSKSTEFPAPAGPEVGGAGLAVNELIKAMSTDFRIPE
jgi:hypothetical protein